ncbi:porphobilinogen synthase [Streptomyces blastmyceticus]|uniref:Delta-aminolevulinic acid dehydratase n=1 Tax=Streptomyces blastmyceticus TaxID=68180 RepID=A0ABP3G8J8_9ACTN
MTPHTPSTGRPANPLGLVHRPRRLRRSPAMRRLVVETRVHAHNLVQPLFVREGISAPQQVNSMPGVVQHTRDSLRKAAHEAAAAGVGGLMLFGIPEEKDALGTGALDPDGILQQAVRDVVSEVGDALVVMTDVNLDEYTDHGHSGVLDASGDVDNDASLVKFGEMAVVQAQAGSQLVAPSGMMDGQIGYMRSALDAAGFPHIPIMGYSAKYASSFYGPFREAVNSSLKGNRKTYQQNPGNARESLHEVALDAAEGADMVMVKPITTYLDVVSAITELVNVPVAAYHVSGEYAMVEAAAARGWIDRESAVVETLTSIRRAGASIILTYWATEFATKLPA